MGLGAGQEWADKPPADAVVTASSAARSTAVMMCAVAAYDFTVKPAAAC